jgi:rhodanese-related sulfurtransferase
VDDGTSARVARLLVDQGYPAHRIAVLAGGIGGWQEGGYPVVRADSR